MRILIIGASGFLGSFCYGELSERPDNAVTGTYGRSKTLPEFVHIDLTSPDSVRNVMLNTNPDIVIWCAKHSSPQLSEETINQIGLSSIFKHSSPNMRLVFVSTDGLLPGLKGPYSETAYPTPVLAETPVALYTNSKIESEKYIASSFQNYCILRVGPIYGRDLNGNWDPRITALLESFERNEVVTRPTNILRTFIHVRDLASAICEIAFKDVQGIFHFGPAKAENYFDFAVAVADAFGYDRTLVVPTLISDSVAQLKHLKMDATMDTSKATACLSTTFRTVKDALKGMVT